MRIGFVTEDCDPARGALPERVYHLAREARRLGHTVRIVTGGGRGAQAGARAGRDDRDVIRLGTSCPVFVNGRSRRVSIGWRLAARLRATLDRERFDVLHVQSPLTPVLPCLALHHARCPILGTFDAHDGPGLLGRVAPRAQQRYLERLDAVVAVSPACAAPLAGRTDVEVHVIPDGVDVERLGRGRRLGRYDDTKLNVLWAGRPEPRDGLDAMIAAFLAVRQHVDARLLVLGDGPLLARYRARVPADAAGDVVFAGAIDEDDRPDWYATADVTCVPAVAASAAPTVLEAMAAGRPVIASDLPEHRERITHGKSGELVPSSDPRAWTRALLRIAREPLRAQAYADQARRAAQPFGWPKVASRVLALYRSIGVTG